METGSLTKTLSVRLMPSTAGADDDRQYATSFRINDVIHVDAGPLGMQSDVEEQLRVRHVLLTHTHIDHMASLPLLLETTFDPDSPPIEIWGSDAVLHCLEHDVFNDRVWPKLSRLALGDRPYCRLHRLEPEVPVEIEGVRFTPVSVNHTVPTTGFLVESADQGVVIPSDTGPTERIWELARAMDNLQAVFLEASFPDAMGDLAHRSKHLTPRLFAAEIAKLRRPADVVAVHLKTRFRERIISELLALDLLSLEIGRPGKEYQW